jgi:hypothetical protein
MGLLRRLHDAIKLRLVRYFRTKEILRVFDVAHKVELSKIEQQYWPLMTRSQGDELKQLKTRLQDTLTATEYKQLQEVAAIRAGRLDIVDRKSWAFPFMPASINRLSIPIAKAAPYNLRRMSRTPVPRRAINLIKNAMISQPWDIRPLEDVVVKDEDEQKERIKIAQKIFRHPNTQDSFQTWLEQGIEDMCILGGFVAELEPTLDPERPLKSWIVNIESIRVFASWKESLADDMPRYAQMTGLKGERGAIMFYDDELLYAKDNPATDSPFGLGKMEVAFASVADFLGVQGMSGRAGTDQVHKTWLWWEQPQADASYQIVRRHIQNELEGQAKVSIIGGMKKPDVLEIQPVLEQDLLLNWQEMLIRMIANAFDMSAMSLGIEHDINKAVGQVLADKDFRSAVVPMAKRLQEAFTRKILHEKLGWADLEFAFLNLEDPDIETKMDMYSRLYSANATTPNRILKAFGMEPLENPFSDLTQFECMMVNMEAMAKVQTAQQSQMMDKQSDIQNDQMDKQQKMQQDNFDQQQQLGPTANPPPGAGPSGAKGFGIPGQGPGGGSPLKMTPGNAAKGGQPPSPKPLTLPKFNVAGSRYNAKQIAQMPVNQLTDVFNGFSASFLLRAMTAQEPGILDEMSDEVRSFFEHQLEEEEKKPKTKISPQMLRMWQKDAKKRFGNKGRITDWAEWLQKRGQQMGKPGGPLSQYPSYTGRPGRMGAPGNPGRPGRINPIKLG